jgi:8-oxo-dGTP pyrophosphatase MutT (NUDIX family)
MRCAARPAGSASRTWDGWLPIAPVGLRSRSAFRAPTAHSSRVAVKRNARATSAGGVVYRRTESGPEIVLAHRRSPALWALPKGTPARGESVEETALRETAEESGLAVAIEQPLPSISYVFVRGSTRYFKTVHFFLMRPVGGDLADHDHEFDDVRWVPLSEALRLMNYPTERSVVEQVERMLAATPEPTARPAS